MRLLTGTILLSLLVLAVGCGGDDPAAPATTPTLTLDGAAAEEWTTASLDMVNGLVVALPAFAAGDFSSWSTGTAAKATDEPVWDPAQQAWTYSFAGPILEMDPPNHFLASIELWVQFRAGDMPLQAALGADEMQVRTAYGLDMHMEDGDASGDLDYLADMDMLVSYLGNDAGYGVTGSGSNAVEVHNVTPEVSEHGRFSLNWTVDLVVTPDGCAEGLARVTTQNWVLTATYDGQGGVAWELVGPGYSAQGTDALACGSVQ